MSAAAPLIPCASSPALSTRRARRARGLGTAARWGVRLAVFGLLVRGDGRPGALAQPLATTVQAPLNDRRDDVSAVSVIDLGLPGQAGAPSAYRVSVAEALAGQPGLVLQRGGGLGQFSGALLRGSSAHQILVLLDGVPILRGGQTAADLSLLPIDGIERIEVHRGAPPFEAGAEGLGGAIALTSRRGRATPSLWGLAGAGSFGLRKAVLGYSGGGSVRSAATLSYQGSDGSFPYLYNEGLVYGRAELEQLYRKSDGFDQLSADVSVRRDGERGGWFAQGHGLLKRQGVPGIGQPGSLPGEPTLDTGRALFHAGGRRLLAAGRVSLGADAHALLERTFLHDPSSAPPRAFEQLGQQAALRLLGRFASAPTADSATGASEPARALQLLTELRYERMAQRDLCPAPRLDCADAAPTESARLRGLLGLGGELRIDGDRLRLEPALHVLLARSELVPLGDRPQAEQPAQLVALPAPRVGARLWLLPGLLVRASAGRFVRLPSFLELFGDRAFFRPSPGLRPESAWAIELGARATTTLRRRLELSLEAHGFHRRIDDLIECSVRAL
mgnify:CR=1 FL=1